MGKAYAKGTPSIRFQYTTQTIVKHNGMLVVF